MNMGHQIRTSCNEIDGWVISRDRCSCSKQGHKLEIVTEEMPARVGGARLPKGSPNMRHKYGSLYKPPYNDYILELDGRCVVRGTEHQAEKALFEYFRRERRIEGMAYEDEKAGPRRPVGGSTMRGVTGIAVLMALSTIEELAKQDPREFDQDIPEEFRNQFKRLSDPDEEVDEGSLPF
jgi:hypothetical protein